MYFLEVYGIQKIEYKSKTDGSIKRAKIAHCLVHEGGYDNLEGDAVEQIFVGDGTPGEDLLYIGSPFIPVRNDKGILQVLVPVPGAADSDVKSGAHG